MLNKQDDAKITPEEFFAWVQRQEERYELVNGEIEMMAGTGRRHDVIVTNLITTVRPQTRGGPCRTFTSDTYVITSPSIRRMPDMGIDSGNPSDESLTADKPALIVEVLSPSTAGFDVSRKLAEYKELSSLEYILFVNTEQPSVQFFWREPDRLWKDTVLEGLDTRIVLERLKVSMSLRDIYDEVDFRPKAAIVAHFADISPRA